VRKEGRLNMSKKQQHESKANEAKELEVKPLKMGDFVKAIENDEVVFVGMISDDTHKGKAQLFHATGAIRWTDIDNCTLVSADEFERYTAVSAQTTLGMGNIIDAVVNG